MRAYTASATSIATRPPKRNHAAGDQRGRVNIAYTVTTTSTRSAIGYATDTARSRNAPEVLSITGVTTHCQTTAESATATTTLSIVVSRSYRARASWNSATARMQYARR